MYFLCVIVIISTSCGFGCNVAEDPCLDDEIKQLPNQHDRCPFCGAGENCDKFGMQHDTWYRFDYVITVTKVAPESCGTVYPIWMNGTFPTASEGIVDRTGCMASFIKICAKEFQLKVRNCTIYYTYCIANLPTGCPQRFCFESPAIIPSDTTQHALSTTSPTTNSTVLSESQTLENVSKTKSKEFTRPQTTTASSTNPNTESEDDTRKISTIAIAASVTLVCFGIIFAILIWRLRFGSLKCKRNDGDVDNVDFRSERYNEERDNVAFREPTTDPSNHYETFPCHKIDGNDSDYDQMTNTESTIVPDNQYEALQPNTTNESSTEYAELDNINDEIQRQAEYENTF